MRQNKVKEGFLKYVVYDKKTNLGSIYHYKTQISKIIEVSTRTLDRNMPYEDENYLVFQVLGVNV